MAVVFEEDNISDDIYKSREILGEPQPPTMVKLLTKVGIKEKYAYYGLMVFAIGSCITALFILFVSTRIKTTSGVPSWATILKMQREAAQIPVPPDNTQSQE